MSHETAQATHSAKLLNMAAHAAFVPVGIVTVLLGPMLPTLSARWSLNYAQAGSLFTAQFIGSTLGVVLSSVLVSRWGFRFAINGGLLVMAAGVAALPFSPRSLGIICILCYGFGLGLSIPAANLLVAEVNPTRRSAALNLLNFSWSVGAVACPFLVAAAARMHRVPTFLVALAASMLLIVWGIAAMSSATVEPSAAEGDDGSGSSPIKWDQRSFVVLCALFFLYVGTENGFGGWIASYAKSVGTAQLTLALMTPSFFYVALLLGRWLAPVILEHMDEINLARVGLLLACSGMVSLILSRTIPLIAASAAIAGLGLAAVYPITISLLSREFGTAASKVGSVMFTMANLGGASLPWLVGYCSNQFNNLRAGLAVPLAAGIVMLGLYQSRWRATLVQERE